MKDSIEKHREVLEEFVHRAAIAQAAVTNLLEGGMMNLESKFKTQLVADCRKLGAYARRHEDRYAIGLLDLSIKFPGHPHLLAEGKLVEHQKFAPTLRQFKEGEDYIAAGGLCALIGWEPKTKVMFVHPWARWAMKEDSFPPGGGFKSHAETLRDWLIWQATK